MLSSIRLISNRRMPLVAEYGTRLLSSTVEIPSVDDEGKKKRKPKKKMANRFIVQNQRARNAELDAKAEASGLPWRYVSATILHRYPYITEEPADWEKAFHEVQAKHEEQRLAHTTSLLAGTDAMLLSEDDYDVEDILKSLPFTPAPRISEADEKNDTRSTERRQDDSLFLIVKRAGRGDGDYAWQFPQGKIADEETVRSAGERVVDRAIGKTHRYYFSNAPCGHYCYEYSPELQKKRGQFGAKVFFNRAQLIEGTVKLETRLYKDYAWIARDEVDKYFDAETATYLSHLLPN